MPEPDPREPAGSSLHTVQRPLARRRVWDWLLGALAMLLLLVLAGWIIWMRLTQPVGTAAESAPTVAAGNPGAATDPFARPGAPTPPASLSVDEVWLGDVSFEAGALVAAGTPFDDVVAHGVDVTSGPNGLVASYLDVTGTVPYHVVEGELPAGTSVGPAGNGEVRIETALEILGRELVVTAQGAVRVESGRIAVDPTAIDLGGPQWLSELLTEIVRELIVIEHEIEGLPEGLTLRTVDVEDDGFRATLVGTDVRVTG
nr:LmeA family phospholipid-binding protein [Actinomycetales bacterium]